MSRAALLALLFVLPSSARAQLLAHLRVSRDVAGLTSADARVRQVSAERLAFEGTHDRIAEPLRTAIEHEAVPEPLSAMVASFARRADEMDLPALEAAWDRTSAADRLRIVGAEDAIGGELALPLLRRHLASEGASARACTALTRTPERVAWLASTLEDAAARDRVLTCLAAAEPSPARDAALLRAGLDLEPASARQVLAALRETTSPAVVAMAEAALARADALLQPAALAILARQAPERLAIDSWQSFLGRGDEREASAVLALLVVAPALADEALERMRTRDPTSAQRALGALLDRDDARDVARIARFAATAATRSAALDRLSASDGGLTELAALPPAPDVDLSIALAHPSGEPRTAVLARTRSPIVRALLGDAGACADGGLAGAMCLALTGDHDVAARALETERDPAIVGWLALASGDARTSTETVLALLDDEATRLPGVSRIVPAMATAPARDRRELATRLVRATTDLDALVRAEAVRALGRLAQPTHRAVVLRALEDSSAQVRLAAALALAPGDRTDLRVRGRAHVEDDPRVLAALEGATLGLAQAPLHVAVNEHDPRLEGTARVTVLLADGRGLSLAPVEGVVLVPHVPDAPAIVHLVTTLPTSRH